MDFGYSKLCGKQSVHHNRIKYANTYWMVITERRLQGPFGYMMQLGWMVNEFYENFNMNIGVFPCAPAQLGLLQY